jgi:uncharacterized delta-60 repeat protein
MKKIYLLILSGSLLLANSKSILAQQGTLDSTFNGTGKLILAPRASHDNANAIVVQQDSGIIVAGVSQGTSTGFDVIVGRILPSGILDTTFGNSGWVVYDYGGFSDYAYDVDLQSDGKIIVTGAVSKSAANTEFLVIRLNPDGSFDSTFSSTGKAVITINTGEDYAQEAVIQNDGKIVLGGYSKTPGFTFNNATLVRLNSDGSLDTTFGTGGISQPNYPTQSDRIDGLVIKPNGSFIAVGYSGSTSLQGETWGILPDGSIDSSYGTNGRQLISSMNYCKSIAEYNNQYYICGYASGANQSGVIAALNEFGTPISSFGTFGITSVSLNLGVTYVDIKIQADGKIITAGGTTIAQFVGDFILSRFETNGSPDATFGTNGHVTVDFSNNGSDNGQCAAIQPDGKILICGVSIPGANNDMTIARVHALSAPVSVNDLNSINESIKVYPNPVHDHFSLQLPQDIKLLNVEMISATGSKLELKKSGLHDFILPENISSGLYIIHVTTNEKDYLLKVIK